MMDSIKATEIRLVDLLEIEDKQDWAENSQDV
jgi:hypothetical protein